MGAVRIEDERVLARTACQGIIAAQAGQPVLAITADQLIRFVLAAQYVIPGTAVQKVTTTAAVQRIVASTAFQGVRLVIACQRIALRGANQVFDVREGVSPSAWPPSVFQPARVQAKMKSDSYTSCGGMSRRQMLFVPSPVQGRLLSNPGLSWQNTRGMIQKAARTAVPVNPRAG